MPAVQGEKLYGPPGPQNNAVLMDIISKLKHDLQQTRAENGKLVDQLNVLISLVKRYFNYKFPEIKEIILPKNSENPVFRPHLSLL